MTNLPVPAHDREHLEAVRYAESAKFVPAIVGLVRRDLRRDIGKTPSQTIRAYLRANAMTLTPDLIDALVDAADALAERENEPRRVGCWGQRVRAHYDVRMVRK